MEDVSFLENQEEDHIQDGELLHLTAMCNKLREKREEILKLEDKLAQIKKEESKLSSVDIPEFLSSKGMSLIKLENGLSVGYKESVKVNLPKKDLIKRKKVLTWIIKNGGADIIKKELQVSEPDQKIIDMLNEECIPYTYKKDIHHSTLTAWINSKLGYSKNSLQEINLDEIPQELGLFIHKVTKIN